MRLLLILLFFIIAAMLIAKLFTNRGQLWGLFLETISTAGISYMLTSIIWKIYTLIGTKSTLIFALAGALIFIANVAGVRQLGHRFLKLNSGAIPLNLKTFLKELAYHASVLWKLALVGEVAIYQLQPSLLNPIIFGTLQCLIILPIIIESAVKMFQVTSKISEN